MAKKKQIYCKCGSPADWYKKGKKHRVLICHNCGMIANNPIPLIAAGAISVGKKLLPKAIEGVGSFLSKEKSPPTTSPTPSVVYKYDSLDKANYSERVINKMLKE